MAKLTQIKFSDIDTYIFDYGGVISFHYCEPWQGNLSRLLKAEPKRVRELLSETSDQGKKYRLGLISREEFWNKIICLANAKNVDIAALENNLARSYQIDKRMLKIMALLRSAGKRVGVMMNTDSFRHQHIEKEYGLSRQADFIISSCRHGVVKPEKNAYLRALELVNRQANPEKVIYLDDRERNITPCQEVGMNGVVFKDFETFKNLLITNRIINTNL